MESHNVHNFSFFYQPPKVLKFYALLSIGDPGAWPAKCQAVHLNICASDLYKMAKNTKEPKENVLWAKIESRNLSC